MKPDEAMQIAKDIIRDSDNAGAAGGYERAETVLKNAIAAALLEAAESKWQPMETAPLTDWILGLPVDWQDYEPWHASTKLLIVRWREAADTDEAAVGFSEEGWRDMDGFRYTLINWMPLPEPPSEKD